MNPEVDRLLERGAVLLVPEGPMRPTEYGKRWMDRVWTDLQHHSNTIRDVARLKHDPMVLLDLADEGERQVKLWAAMEQALKDEGVPTNITSGVSQYGMAKLIDHINDKAAFTAPTTVAMGLWTTTAPTSTSTGALANEATYTGYARVTLATAAFNPATAATPSVSTNASTITFGNCTAGTSTLVGFELVDNATVASGNALWYGTLSSVVISTTQTPPTVAAGSLSLSMTGT